MTPEQRTIADELDRLLGPEAARRFRDCCRIMTDPRLESPAPLLGHGLRELESLVRDALTIPGAAATAPTPQLQATASQAEAALRQIGIAQGEAAAIGRQIANRNRHNREVTAILSWLELPHDGDTGRRWRSIIQDSALRLSGHAHRRSFLGPGNIDEVLRRDVWDSFNVLLRDLLPAVERRYVTLLQRVDELVRGDRQNAVRELTTRIPLSNVVQLRFFTQLRDSSWLQSLANTAFFVRWPPVRVDEETGRVLIAPWPPGEFLRRAATSDDPAILTLIGEIVTRLSQSDHPGVQLALLQTLIALPPERAAEYAHFVIQWISGPSNDWLAHFVVDLIDRLARGGRGAAALTLFDAAFRLEPRADEHDIPQTRFGHGAYEYALGRVARPLVEAAGRPAVESFIGLLRQSGEIAGRFSRAPRDDFSYMWRRKIARDEGNARDVMGALIDAVRDGSLILAGEPAVTADLVTRLEAEGYPIFRRLALHLLAHRTGAASQLAAARMVDSSLLDASWCRFEFGELACAQFGQLSDADQQRVLDMAQPTQGEIDSFQERYRGHHGRDPSSEDIAAFQDIWLRDRLWEWRSVLPHTWRQRVMEIAGRLGEPVQIGVVVRAAHVSSQSAAELATFAPIELVAHLQAWAPDSDDPAGRRATPSSLANELKRLVYEQPQRFAEHADHFIGLDPTFVRGLLSGFGDAIKAGRPFVWEPLLRLLLWVTLRSDSADQPAQERQRAGWDPTWQWAWHAAAEVMRYAFCENLNEIPASGGDAAWAVVERLLEYPPPTHEEEAENNWIDRDPYFVATNSIRGCALIATIYRALWNERLARARGTNLTLDDMPEVLAVVNRELAAPSRMALSVFGRFLPHIRSIGPNWFSTHSGHILPLDPERQPFWLAAWLGYVKHASVLTTMVGTLRTSYERAIEALAVTIDGTTDDEEDGAGRELTRHMATILWFGAPDLAAQEVFDQFIERADDEFRANLMEIVGNSLRRRSAENQTPTDVAPLDASGLTRIREFFEHRLALGEQPANTAQLTKELGAFASWLDSDQFDPGWKMRSLTRVLTLGVRVRPVHRVIVFLQQVAREFSDEAVNALDRILLHPEEDRWLAEVYRDEVAAVLAQALHQESNETQGKARSLISALEARGIGGFMRLLATRSNSREDEVE